MVTFSPCANHVHIKGKRTTSAGADKPRVPLLQQVTECSILRTQKDRPAANFDGNLVLVAQLRWLRHNFHSQSVEQN
jgi:hypothetical protein